MPTTGAVSRLREWATTQRTVTTLAALLVAMPTAYAFRSAVGGIAGGFLLLWTLGVGVPSAYRNYWPTYDRTWRAVAWVLVACAVATVAFTGLHVVGTAVAGLSPFLAAVGAFLVTYLGTFALLSRR